MPDLDDDKTGERFGTGHKSVLLESRQPSSPSAYCEVFSETLARRSQYIVIRLHFCPRYGILLHDPSYRTEHLMIQSRTVFVVGAGASREAGLPTGAELKRVIAEKMNFIFDSKSDSLKSGDRNVYDALMVYANAERRYWPEVMKHVQWISDAMPQAISIDNFLDAHRTNSELELCGKLGIAQRY